MAGFTQYYNDANGGGYYTTLNWMYPVIDSIESAANEERTGYNTTIKLHLYAAYEMRASSHKDAMTIYLCSEVSETGRAAGTIYASKTTDSLALQFDGNGNSESTSISMTNGASDSGVTSFYVVCDYSNYVGSNGPGGIGEKDIPYLVMKTMFSDEYSVDTPLFPPLITAPSIGAISLKNPKEGSTTVSNSPTNIQIQATPSGDAYTSMVTWIDGPGVEYDGWDGATHGKHYYYDSGDYFATCYDSFTALIKPRTTYTFDMILYNSAGNSGWAGEKSFRSLSDAPTVSAKAKGKTLNSVTFTWESNYELNKIYYKYKIGDNGSWSTETSQSIDSKKSGDITISNIAPNTKVCIMVKGTEALDSQTSSYPNDANASQTTYDIAWTIIADSITHSGSIGLSDTGNPSGNTMTLVMYDGNTTIASWNIGTNDKSVSLTEAQWDNVYKRYGNSNTKNYQFYLYTANDSGTWNAYNRNVTRTVTLTGIQKTAHVGSNGAKRAMVWYSVNGVMKHAVVWVGAGGGTKRTI